MKGRSAGGFNPMERTIGNYGLQRVRQQALPPKSTPTGYSTPNCQF